MGYRERRTPAARARARRGTREGAGWAAVLAGLAAVGVLAVGVDCAAQRGTKRTTPAEVADSPVTEASAATDSRSAPSPVPEREAPRIETKRAPRPPVTTFPTVFAPGEEVIDVTAAPYNADATGQTDCTAAMQAAFKRARADALERYESRGGRAATIVYVPDGTYLVSDMLSFGPEVPRGMYLVGQSRTGAVIRLAPRSPRFGDVKKPRPVVTFCEDRLTKYWHSNTSFNNAVRNLTIEVGEGNPGAVGLDFHNNNTGFVDDLVVRSLDPEKRGAAGMRVIGGLGGIGLITDLEVDGFDVAVRAGSHKICYTFERVAIRDQRVAGFVTRDKPLQIRRLESVNRVPALIVEERPAQVVLIDSELTGGAPGAAAIENRGFVFVRNVRVDGYGAAIDEGGKRTGAGHVEEHVTGGVVRAFDDAPTASIGLPIEDAPEAPYDPPSTWTVVDGATQDDDAGALQEAIDGGATTVYVKTRLQLDRTVVLRGNVRRLLGASEGVLMHGGSLLGATKRFAGSPDPLLRIETGAHPVTFVERINMAFRDLALLNASDRTVVIKHAHVVPYRNTGTGDLFLEGVSGGSAHGAGEVVRRDTWVFRKQNVWIRHLNPENSYPHVVNDGGSVWIMGFKFGEWNGPYVVTLNGGRTEVLGGLFNALGHIRGYPHRAMVVNDNSDVAVVAVNSDRYDDGPHAFAVREIRRDEERTLTHAQMPARGRGKREIVFSLYRGDSRARSSGAKVRLEALTREIVEGPNATARFRAVREGDAADALTVHVAPHDDSTCGASDFTRAPRSVSIPAGARQATFSYVLADDDVREDAKTLALVVTGGDGYEVVPQLTDPPSIVIFDDESDLAAGLLAHFTFEDGVKDVSGSGKPWKNRGVRVEKGPGGAWGVFGGKGKDIMMGKERSRGGYMHSGFDAMTFAARVRVKKGERGWHTLFRCGGWSGFFVKLDKGRLHLNAHVQYLPRAHVGADWTDDGAWHHVAAVFHHGRIWLYLDGRMVGTDRFTSPWTLKAESAAGVGVNGFRGHMDDVRVYGRALSAGEVLRLSSPSPR